jgi:Fic family protein
MDDLVRFAVRTDLPALAQIALAHAQFETIHPFPDGNGRTGRALVHAMLHRLGAGSRNRLYESLAVLDCLERFAARSRRAPARRPTGR